MSAAPRTALTVLKRFPDWLAVGFVYALLAWVGMKLGQSDSRVAAIWLPNAVMLAAGLIWRMPVARIIAPAFVANIALAAMMGDAPRHVISFSIANMAEIGIAITLSRRFIARPEDIKDARKLARFLVVAAFAAAASALIAALAADIAPAALLSFGWQWWLADTMALTTIAPILLVIEADRIGNRRRGTQLLPPPARLDVLLGAIAIAAIFAQTAMPLLFLAVPVILAVAARRGSAASALLLLITTLVSVAFTMADLGPIHLIEGDLHLKIAVLQIFILATFVSTLPITLANERIDAMRERTLTLVELMDEIPFSVDLSGRWTYLSRQWSARIGQGAPLPIGRRALWIVPPDRRRALLEALVAIRKGEMEETQFEFRAHLASPDPLYLKVRIKPLRARGGGIEGFGGIITDVSTETMSQQALAFSEQRLLSLAEHAPVGIFLLDRDGNATFLNNAWVRITGMSAAEGMGRGWQRTLDPHMLEQRDAQLSEREAGVTTDVEFLLQRPDGTQRHTRVVTTGLRDGDGAIIGHIGVLVDQTREHEAMAALIAALEEAKSAATAKDRFLALMSHELRTPMNGVLGFAERLQEGELTDNQRRYVALIARSGEIMLALLNDILDTSRMRAGQMQLAREPYDVSATITGICQHFEPLAAQRGLQLRCTFASPLPQTVVGDRQRVTQILNNLLGNSLKFTTAGWISVYARLELQYERTILILEVSDTGIGIAPELGERIFEAFDQGADDTAMRFGGTGLGLPIARSLAEQMGGSLHLVTSNVGKGSIFRLTLPLELRQDDVAARAKPTEALAPQPVATTARPLNVLVAEDNEINRHLMAELLGRRGHAVDMVPDGQQAVDAVLRARAEARPYDIVFMDLRMPVMGGVEATRTIRAQGIDGRALPIVAVTASVHQDAMDACWQAGMQDYVTKPVMRAAIDAVFEKWGGGDSEAAQDAPETAVLDPDLVPLLPRFIEQCSDGLAGIGTALDAWPETDAAQLGTVQSMAHSLAGLAATFAAPMLIAPAQALDLALDGSEADTTRQALIEMRDALKTYLAEAPIGTDAA